MDWGRAKAICRDGEESAHAEESAAAAVGERVSSEFRIRRNTWKFIDIGQIRVDEAVIGRKQLGDRAILLDDVTEEGEYLFDHIFTDAFAMVMLEPIRIRGHEVDVVQVEPGVGECTQERLAARLRETLLQLAVYAGERVHFPRDNGLLQCRVWDGALQEVTDFGRKALLR